MQFDLIKEVLTGSITGYITNALAIKMIFREYGIGKAKLGGIVVKTRNEFSDNVSSLVERDIINCKTLSRELTKESFNNSIKKFSNDLLKINIYDNTSNMHFGDIEGFNSTISKTENYMKQCANDHFPSVFNSLCKNIHIKDLVSEKQVHHISEDVFDCTFQTLNDNKFIEKAIDDFYNENKSMTFGEFFESEFLDVISKNFQQSFMNFHVDIKDNFNLDIDKAFEKTIETLQIHKILNTVEEKLLEKRIIDFSHSENENDLSTKLIAEIKEFIQSNQGKILIDDFSKELFNRLKCIDKPVLDFFSQDLRDNTQKFLENKLQYAVKEIILWIEKNREDIENLIENAIDDTIDSIDDDIKRGTLNSLRDGFLNNVAKKFQIVSKITEYLEENADIEGISKDITLIIIKYLKEEKVSNIVNMLEKNNIFTEESLGKFINYNLMNYLEYMPENYFTKVLDKEIKNISNINLVNIFETYIKKPLINRIKENYIYTEDVTKFLTEQLVKNLKNINDLNFEQIITEEFLSSNSHNVKKVIMETLNNNKNNIINLFSKELNSSIDPEVTLYKVLNEYKRKILFNEIVDMALNKTHKLFNISKDIQVKKVCDVINNVENVDEILAEYIQLLFKNNLEYILSGNIKKAVCSNLYNLKDEELQVMVEEFMGKEMKPITMIGALLGAVVGIGMYFFDKSTVQYSYAVTTAINVVVYALVGWITNVQAVAMLFKPYTEKRIFGIKIPFTPGVIVSRKPRFAKSMSGFVDEELLNRDSIEELFNKNREFIYTVFKDTISKDDYKILVDFLCKHSDAINNKSYDYVKQLINDNKDKISNFLVSEVSGYSISNMDFSNIESKAQKEILKAVKDSHVIISKELIKLLKSDEKTLHIIPKEVKELIEKQLSKKIEKKIDTLSDYINKENSGNKVLIKFSKEYEELINKPVKEIINSKHIEKLNESLNNIIRNKIGSEETTNKIFNWIEGMILKELNPNKNIGELFNGFFVKIIKNNFNYIVDNTLKAVVKGISNKQQTIAEVAITTTQENLNFFERIGYNMFGGNQLIAEVVHNLINNKVPIFINEKKEELHKVLENFIDNEICNSTVGDLQIKIESSEILNSINKFINTKENISALNDNIMKTAESMGEWVSEGRIEKYLNILSVNRIEDFMDVFKYEIQLIEKSLGTNININKETLINEYSKLTYEIFESLILSRKISDVTEGVNEEYIQNICKKFTGLIYNSNIFKENLSHFTQALVNDKFKAKNVNELLDCKEVNNSIASVVEKISKNQEIHEELKNLIGKVTKGILVNNLNIIEPSTKEFINDIVVNSIVDAAGDNFSNIINTIDFRGITEKEINNMEPKEIEDLFNSFAKKYFERLKLYGLGGAIFGLHWIIGIASFALYSGHSIKDKMKN